jgi:glycine betaine/choline ABC-type transport system substrate-binding protein
VQRMKAVIITGSARYEKELSMNYWVSPIWKITTETMNQLNSEQYILAKGFKKVAQ